MLTPAHRPVWNTGRWGFRLPRMNGSTFCADLIREAANKPPRATPPAGGRTSVNSFSMAISRRRELSAGLITSGLRSKWPFMYPRRRLEMTERLQNL